MIEKNQDLTLKEQRKNQIVLSALKVFCKKGYDGATVNDIVKHAKCSHGLFYHYFKNKKELFDAVSEIRGKHMMTFLDDVLKDDSNYVEKLYKLTQYTFENIKNDEIFAYRYYFFVTTVFNNTKKCNRPHSNETPPHLRMFAFFEKGINRGDFNDNFPPEECAKLYNSIIQGATLNFILCPKEFKQNFKFPMLEFIVNIFKKGGN